VAEVEISTSWPKTFAYEIGADPKNYLQEIVFFELALMTWSISV
jgi:hypothetical protein